MQRRALTMKIHEGAAAEYQRRHDEIWPELNVLLQRSGIVDYTIFLDEENLTLFAVLFLKDDHKVDHLSEEPLIQRWWSFMADIMVTDANGAPRTWPLKEVYHLG